MMMSKRRPTLTCKRCRERRVLCDRRKPCWACIRNKKPHLCVYDTNDELEQMKGGSSFRIFRLSDNPDDLLLDIPLSEILLKLNGKNLLSSKQERINFHERYTPRLKDESIEIEYGPLAWPFLERKEPALHMMLKYIRDSRMTEDMNLNILEFFQAPDLRATANDLAEFWHETTNTLLLRIKNILPSRRIVWKLISIFFRHVYSFMPILDEISFQEEIKRIIGPEDYYTGNINPSIKKIDDFAIIGILLILLRIASLQEEKNYDSYVSDDIHIGSENIDVAIMCLRRYNFMGKISLSVFQCTFFLKLYQKVCPVFREDSHDRNSKVYNGMLVQMAYSLGLNKKPHMPDRRMNNLRQKMWHLLVVFDIIESYSFGSPLTANRLHCTARLIPPNEIDNNNSNNLDFALEKTVLRHLITLMDNMNPLIDILDKISDVNGLTKISSLVNLVNKVEIRISTSLGFLKDPLIPVSEDISTVEIHDKIHRIKSLISTKIFLLSIYQHLAIHFQHTKNSRLAMFYRKKIQCITIGEMLPLLLPLTEDMRNYFGSLGVLVISSFFFQSIYRATLLNMEVLILFKYQLYYFTNIYTEKDNESSIYSYLCRAIEKLEKCIVIFILCISKLSKKYNYTNKPKDLLNAYLCILKKDDFYESNANDKALVLKLTTDYLKQMCYIYDAALEEIAISPYCLDSVEISFCNNDINEKDILSSIDLATLTFDTTDYLNLFGNNYNIVDANNPFFGDIESLLQN